MGQFSKVYNLTEFEVHKQSLANKLFRIEMGSWMEILNGKKKKVSLVGHNFPMG